MTLAGGTAGPNKVAAVDRLVGEDRGSGCEPTLLWRFREPATLALSGRRSSARWPFFLAQVDNEYHSLFVQILEPKSNYLDKNSFIL